MGGVLTSLSQRSGELKGAEEEAKQKIEKAQSFAEGLKPPELQSFPPPKPASTDPKEVWGSAAMLLAGIGSLMTRRPIVSAMNAASQVFNAYHQKDQAAANQAYEAWKISNENAIKLADFQMTAYKAALAKSDHDEKTALAEFTATAHAFQDETAVQTAQLHGLDGIQRLMLERERLGVEIAKAQPELDQKHAQWDAYLGLHNARANMQKAVASKDPAKIQTAQSALQDAADNVRDLSASYGHGTPAGGQAGDMTDDDMKSMAEQYLAGDKSVLQGLGYGNQGAANRARLQHAIRTVAKDNGMSGSDVAASIAEFQGMTAGERTLGTTAARIGLGAAEMQTLIPQVEQASKELPRGNYPTMNSMMQAMQKETGNPNLRSLAVRLQGLKSAYSQVLTRGGVPTDSARAATDELFSTKDPETVLQAAIGAIKQETSAIREAPGIVRGELRHSLGSNLRSPNNGNAAKIYHYDAQGNRVP